MKHDVYLIGSLKNAYITELGVKLRKLGFDVFDDWKGAGPEADDEFNKYRQQRGLTYKEALRSYGARHIFEFDRSHIDAADTVVLVMPAGKSGHLELGYAMGKGKKGYILFDKEPERIDQMYQFATDIFFDEKELTDALTKTPTSEIIFKVSEAYFPYSRSYV